MSAPIYSLKVNEVFNALESSPDGLSGPQVEERLALNGSNQLSVSRHVSNKKKLLAHLTHLMALMLWIAGALAFVIHEPVLGSVIWVLVLVNGGFSLWREHRTEQALSALSELLPTYARIIRSGVETRIPADKIVPGDILILAEGDNIPADARVVEAYGLRINNANLTGEAVPSLKTSDASLQDELSEVERPNLVFAGTSVVSGTGRAVVFATGMLTQFGRIARLTQEIREEPSPLQRELVRITRLISLAAIGIGISVFVVAFTDVHLATRESFILSIGIIVAAIPEGLPATITLSLAIAAQRLAQQGVWIKKLSTIETLGNVSIICTDKSGTLTQNQMTVRQIWVAGQRYSVSGVGYNPQGNFSPTPDTNRHGMDLETLLTAAMLCNNSRLIAPVQENPVWSCLGDQTEAALRAVARKSGLQENVIEAKWPRVHELPFDARRKRMSTIHTNAQNGSATRTAFIKGAPREVLQLCTSILFENEVIPLDDSLRSTILEINDEFARSALRVLALARRDQVAPSGAYTPEKIEKELTFLGLIGMMDPPRPEVSQAVSILKQAGIRLVMITGDYGLTAVSLARRIGMLTSAQPRILTGAEIEVMHDNDLKLLLDQEIIFARMAPEHKLRLVAAYQERGEVVAVTGDGVNDAPALRKADVGIAMGLIGTDVAKEASDVIITNDNFASIVAAVQEGRTIYANLRKFITYIFSSNVPELLPFILTALFNLPLALMVKQILAIDLGTDLLPALALSTEKPEPDTMLHPPRRRNQPLIDRNLLMRSFLWLGLIEAALCYSAFFFALNIAGMEQFKNLPLISEIITRYFAFPTHHASVYAVTLFHAGVVTSQVGNAFACRTEVNRGRKLGWLSNRFLLVGVLIEFVIIISLIYIPSFAHLFDHLPLPLGYWLGLVLFAPLLYSLDWIRKYLLRRSQH